MSNQELYLQKLSIGFDPGDHNCYEEGLLIPCHFSPLTSNPCSQGNRILTEKHFPPLPDRSDQFTLSWKCTCGQSFFTSIP